MNNALSKLTSLTQLISSMCSVDVATNVFEYGDRVNEDMNFQSYSNPGSSTCPGRKENPLGSSRKKGKCGQSTFISHKSAGSVCMQS